MFARSVVRCAGAARQGARSYATEAAKGGSSTPWIVGAAAAATGIAGYTFLGNQKANAEAAPSTEKEGEKLAKKAFLGGEQGFIDLKLKEAKDYNHNTKSFIFELPESDQVSGMNVASAVITKFKAADQDKPTIRPYTPTSDPDEKGFIELLVKKYPNGPMSEHLHSLKPGETLSMKGPIPKYPWAPNKHDHITLIAGGTGITPMYQLIQTIFKNPEDKTKVSLVFGNISEEDILLKEKFDEYEKKFPQRFKAFYTLDKPKDDKWAHGKGFITKDLLKEIIPDSKSENIKVFICGPPGLYKAISGPKVSPTDQGDLTGILKDLGYTKEQVYKF